MSKDLKIGLGLIGCGAFGNFCLEEFQTMSEVEVVGVTDTVDELAEKTAERLGVKKFNSQEEMLSSDAIDLVHIATPPKTHADLAMAALNHGKHVLCEKPLATTCEDAKGMVDLAKDQGLILAVNLIMRYNPLCEAVARILQQKLLGEPIHALFENYAGDDKLTPDHWFWDKSESGGIFVEHAVHFFDLYNYWFGDGQVEASQTSARPGAPDIEEQVQALVRHPQGVLSTFYHGFHQPGRLDRQEFRIVCERGDIRLFEWVPTTMSIDCMATKGALEELKESIPNSTSETTAEFEDDNRHVMGRHKRFTADGRYSLRGDSGMDKQELYGYMVRALLADQIAAIADPAHERRVSESNGYKSLRMATVAADKAAIG